MPWRSFLAAASASQLSICVETWPKNNSWSNMFSYTAASAILLVLLVLSRCFLRWANAHWSAQSAGSKVRSFMQEAVLVWRLQTTPFRCHWKDSRQMSVPSWFIFSWHVSTFSNVNSTKTSENGREDIIWNLMDSLQLFSLWVTVQSHMVMGICFVRSCLDYKGINGRGRFSLS